MTRPDCTNWVGDDDCNRCCIHGLIYACPNPCAEYEDVYGRKDAEREPQ